MTRILELTLRNKLAVLLFFGIGATLGLYAMTSLPVDAIPDITPIQVIVNTDTKALDPEQIEKTVTFPIETEMSGIAKVSEVRSLSKYGLAQVTVTFEDGTDIYWARQQVAERLQGVRGELPAGVSPGLAPISTGLGEIVMYVVLAKAGTPLAAKPEKERLIHLRTVHDFVLAPYLKRSIKNAAGVDVIGGYQKEIHIEVQPGRLDQYGLSIEQLGERLEALGESVGGGYIQPRGRQVIVRASGRIQSLEEIMGLPVKLDVRGKPVPLSSVATVVESFSQRNGVAVYDGEESVLGTVLMLSGANSRQVALDAEEALKAAPLPPDVEVKLVYSRSFLVNATLQTVAKNLAEGAALVVAILLLILGNVGAALFVSLAIPLSMLFGVAGMRWLGVSASLMSLGAVDFGLLVDGAVVIVENALRRLEEHRGSLDPEERRKLIVESASEVMKPVTLGLAIIMLVYVPILALEGVEGKLFHPMALTVLMALAASLLVAVFLMPVLAYFYLRPPQGDGSEERFVYRNLRGLYQPILEASLRRPALALVPALALTAAAIAVYSRMGADFMPALDEGDIIVNMRRAGDIGIDASLQMQKESDRVIAGFPEVEVVFSRVGTGEAAMDAMGPMYSDTFVIPKKDRSQWPSAENGRKRTKRQLYLAIKEALDRMVPGQEINETQPIEMRFGEILEGSRADVSLKIYGKELPVLMGLQDKAVEVLEALPGVEEVALDELTALRKGPVLSVRPDYAAIARYGLDVHRVNGLLQAAMGGKEVGSFYEQQWRFPIVLKLGEKHRENIETIKSLPVGLPDGGVIPLHKVATFQMRDEVTTIAHDYSQRYAGVAVFLAGRDIASFVAEAREAIEKKLALPEGYSVKWGGQFKNLERAGKKLAVIIPLVLVGILLILWRTFGSLRQALLVYVTIPLAMTGGVFFLALRGIPLSVSASVGFIALMGIAILNGMVLVTFFNQLRAKGLSAAQAAREGSLGRLRPVAMTALVASLGFVPMALNSGLGAEVQRPLATVVIGGIITATLLTLLVLPAAYSWLESRKERDS